MRIRAALQRVGLNGRKIQRYGVPSNNEVMIDLDVRETNEQALDQGKVQIINALETKCSSGQTGSEQCQLFDIEQLFAGEGSLAGRYRRASAIHRGGRPIVDYRDKARGGVLSSLDELKTAVDPAVVASLQEGFFLSDFGVSR